MKPQDQLILVTGATGQQGNAVINHLLSSGFTNVIALVRNASEAKAQALASRGVQLQEGDLDDPTSIAAAMSGVYGVFVALPLDQLGPEVEIKRGRMLVDAAKTAGVKHFIYSSVSGADKSEGVVHFHTKFQIEEYLRRSGLTYSIVRPAPFMENFLTFERPAVNDGTAVFRVAIPASAKRPMVAVDDIGLVVARLFEDLEHSAGRTVELAGDDLTGPQIAALFADITGMPAQFVEQPIAEVRGFNPMFAAMFEWLAAGNAEVDMSQVRAEYPQITSLRQWFTDHKAAFVTK